MSILCFGSFARVLKDATSLNNDCLIEKLFQPFYPDAVPIDSTNQSKLLNSKMNVPLNVSDKADTPAIVSNSEKYFSENIILFIKQGLKHKLISLLVGIINGDTTIPEKEKTAFISKADDIHLADFLSNVFLYAIQQPNKLANNPIPIAPTDNSAYTIIAGRIYVDGQEMKVPDKLTPPDTIDNGEARYITELLKAYAEAENLSSITTETIPEKYQRNFTEQRQHFYNAEAINRRVRDTGLNDQFEIFIQDTYDGVIDVCDQNYTNGYERLLKVLQQAVNRPKGKSLLETLPNWIGNSEKKGACHILVNDKKITWVIINE